jgi:hypothetical protein
MWMTTRVVHTTPQALGRPVDAPQHPSTGLWRRERPDCNRSGSSSTIHSAYYSYSMIHTKKKQQMKGASLCG